MGTQREARTHWRRMRRPVLLVAAAASASLVVGGSLAVSGATPAGASGGDITVHCPDDDLGFVISQAAPGSTIVIDGTCTGNFYIDKDLTLKGPAVLDGGGTGPGLNVAAGTVVVNDLTIQNGAGINGLGGGIWNGGQLTLNLSTVTNNHAFGVGGVFNFGQLTLNQSTVSHNTADGMAGGIFNCAASFHAFGLCTGAPGNLTLNSSTVSENVARFNGGGIRNDAQANLTVNGSTVSGNTTGSNGGGIANDGTATLSKSTVSNNNSTGGGPPSSWSGGGGIANTGPTTLSNSIVQGNSAAHLGGGIFAAGAMTINNVTVSDNSAVADGGGMVAWDGPTAVNNSAFSNNTDGGVYFPDNPAGVWVAPMNFGGFFTNNPSFTTHHSSFG
jgi:predicted outer membrane repeat protein